MFLLVRHFPIVPSLIIGPSRLCHKCSDLELQHASFISPRNILHFHVKYIQSCLPAGSRKIKVYTSFSNHGSSTIPELEPKALIGATSVQLACPPLEACLTQPWSSSVLLQCVMGTQDNCIILTCALGASLYFHVKSVHI